MVGKIEILKRQPTSELALPTLVITKKNKTVHFISDFRFILFLIFGRWTNDLLEHLFHSLKILPYSRNGWLHLCYGTRLKYGLLHHKIGSRCAKDMFYHGVNTHICSSQWTLLRHQTSFNRNVRSHEVSRLHSYVSWWPLTITRGTFDYHLKNWKRSFDGKKAGLHVTSAKSNFAHDKTEYLGYILIRRGVKPQEKVKAV